MHLDGNTIPVVPHLDPALVAVEVHLEGVHLLFGGGAAHVVVRGVDQDLVEDFVEARHVPAGARDTNEAFYFFVYENIFETKKKTRPARSTII